MRQFKTIAILISFFALPAFAESFTCDTSNLPGAKPASDFVVEARSFLGKAFVEEDKPFDTRKTLSFKNSMDSTTGAIAVGWWGSPVEGMPFGKYFVCLTSENSFNLMLSPFSGNPPALIKQFDFFVNENTGEVGYLKATDDDSKYLRVK